jgi:hypothetical protein
MKKEVSFRQAVLGVFCASVYCILLHFAMSTHNNMLINNILQNISFPIFIAISLPFHCYFIAIFYRFISSYFPLSTYLYKRLLIFFIISCHNIFHGSKINQA